MRVSFPKSSYNFYPRPPRGGRPCSYSRITKGVLFLSTPSARRATKVYKDIQVGNQISIHALREEGDTCCRPHLRPAGDFYPRPPRGGRPADELDKLTEIDFYPRPPRGGRLMHLGFIVQAADISIHALREEGDFRLCAAFSSPPISIHALREEGDSRSSFRSRPAAYFYPRPPRGGRRRLWRRM